MTAPSVEQITPHDSLSLKGGAPNGMWRVAWRQHRFQIAVLMAIVVVAAAALILLRLRIIAVYGEFGCELFPAEPAGNSCVDTAGYEVWNRFGSLSALAHLAMVAVPIVLGVFAAAPIFTREFAHGTHVLALTQSMGRGRWFAVKTTVVAAPLVAGLLVLGYLMEWTDNSVTTTAFAGLRRSNFFVQGIIPAGVGLMAFRLALAIGMITRNLLAALIVGALVGGAILAGLALVQPYVLPGERHVLLFADAYPRVVTQADIGARMIAAAIPTAANPGPNREDRRRRYLDADGHNISVSNVAVSRCYENADTAAVSAATATGLSPDRFGDSPEYWTAYNGSIRGCFSDLGVAAQYRTTCPAACSGRYVGPSRGSPAYSRLCSWA